MIKDSKEFDAIIKANLIKLGDIPADSFGYETNDRKYDNYYTFNSFEAFKADMKEGYPQHYKKYGSEITPKGNEPPHMASVGSSSRFCYLALRDVAGVEFEKECPIFANAVPHLDAYISQEYCNVFIEAKCHEFFNPVKIKMENSYLNYFEKNGFFLEILSNKIDGKKQFTAPLSLFGIDKESSHFDVKQFICHLLGIAENIGEKPAKLVYLFFIPDVEDEQTKKEIKEFFDQLQGEIKAIFTSEPIVKFCKEKNISLSAIAEKSKTMETLTTENTVVLV